MEVLSGSDYRKHLAASFNGTDEGERELRQRKNSFSALVSIGSENLPLSSRQPRQVGELAESIK